MNRINRKKQPQNHQESRPEKSQREYPENIRFGVPIKENESHKQSGELPYLLEFLQVSSRQRR